MAWLTTYGASNRVDDGEDKFPVSYSIAGGTTNARQITVAHYRYVGMTRSAAITCRDTVEDPTGTPNVSAQVEREGPGGNYQVVVTETTAEEWEVA